MNSKLKQLICIISMYVIFLAILPLITNINSSAGVIIMVVIGIACYFKFTNGKLNNYLSQFMWPVWLVGMLLVGGTIGILLAPYNLGKWIASKIPDKNNGVILTNEYLMSLNEEQLKNVWMDLQRQCLAISKEYSNNFGEAMKNNAFLQRPICEVYGCKTVAEALNLSEKVMEVVRKKYPKQVNVADLVR